MLVLRPDMSRNKRKKKQADRKAGTLLFAEWQKERLERDCDFPEPAPGPSEVTVVTHFAPGASDRAAAAVRLECALRETWRNCGFLRTVVVAGAESPELSAFASGFGGRVEVRVEPSIRSGRPADVAAFRAARLPDLFRTGWVLVVSDDAFPVRPGLGSYIDRFDFIGAPHPLSDAWLPRAAASLFGIRAMDGSFSLRTRAICLRVAAAWSSRMAGKPVPADFSDGLFATSFLPARSLSYRRAVRLPTFGEALRFAHRSASAVSPGNVPFGFSGVDAFLPLAKAGLA